MRDRSSAGAREARPRRPSCGHVPDPSRERRSGRRSGEHDSTDRGLAAAAKSRRRTLESPLMTTEEHVEATIENLLREDRTFPPPAGFVADAVLSDHSILERT